MNENQATAVQITATPQAAPTIIAGTELAPLPEMTSELVAYQQAPNAVQAQIEALINEINMND
ncbi:MAG: toxic anion resistance protein, partial [Thiothrix sp.]